MFIDKKALLLKNGLSKDLLALVSDASDKVCKLLYQQLCDKCILFYILTKFKKHGPNTLQRKNDSKMGWATTQRGFSI